MEDKKTCERCGEEARFLWVIQLPRPETVPDEAKERKICSPCMRGLTEWWYLG